VATGPLFLPSRLSRSERKARELAVAIAGNEREPRLIHANDRVEDAKRPETIGRDALAFSSGGNAFASSRDRSALPSKRQTTWEMRYPLLGDSFDSVHVPTHFFKVVLCEDSEGKTAFAAAFVLPNAPIPPETSLERFVAPLSLLESVSGLSFFNQGALRGDRRDQYDAAERFYFEQRENGNVDAFRDGEALGTNGDSAKTSHVCLATACVLPPGFDGRKPAGKV
jgi:hypothetical protein